jgi:thiopurine S-methyltransferase
MNNEYWLKRWNENRIGFHRAGVNPLLEEFLPLVSTSAARTLRILAPLSGKSADLAWLVERGHNVVGVDISEIAARTFASEQGIAMTVVHEPPFTVLKGDRITYYVGDFFNIRTDQIGRFDLIYDRAALIALTRDIRPAYAQKLKALLAAGGSILLIALEYDPKKMEGPPFAVTEAEVRSLFKEQNIEKLRERDCIDEESRFKERGLDWMKEVVYRIKS